MYPLKGNRDATGSEPVIARAKQVAQECTMQAAYFRWAFAHQARRETLVAALLIPLGLILFLVRMPAAGFFLFICGVVAGREAYTDFRYAYKAYGEYKEMPEDHEAKRTSMQATSKTGEVLQDQIHGKAVNSM
jgi:hypothetical protein